MPVVLEIDGLVPAEAPEAPPVSLRLESGQLALLGVQGPEVAGLVADCCCGLARARSGTVRLLGHDLGALPAAAIQDLQARIGRVPATGGWLPHLGTGENVLLPLQFHTPIEIAPLREAAALLARDFGLPGLPLARPSRLPALDLLRAACVRAFLGQPVLLLLEIGVEEPPPRELMQPLLRAIGAARGRGAACLWMTGSPLLLADSAIPAAQRLRLPWREEVVA
jgi:phospholipid/cholesterol/gamma-HCH transport system ATP-binding protein